MANFDLSLKWLPTLPSFARLRRMAPWVGLSVLILLLLVGGTAYWLLRGSMAQVDGRVTLAGLSAPVTIARDHHGVPSIAAANQLDAARALGYAHAQDRFFQMDLLRRAAAGELSALVGPGAIGLDRKRRRFRMRAVAEKVLRQLPPRQRALIGAYALGVNEGLAGLDIRPFVYLLLGEAPKRWRPEDSILVIMAMYFKLQDAADAREQGLAAMHAVLAPELFDFITAPGTRWDAPMRGGSLGVPPIPGADAVDLGASSTALKAPRTPLRDAGFVGSNSWALAGARTASGGGLLANDMHLGLDVPPIWYQARLSYPRPNASNKLVEATGVTLPGLPGIIAGSNGHIAWGFTNAYGDWVDLVRLEPNPAKPGEYRTANGWQPYTVHRETIVVRDAPNVTLTVRDTIWGPVIGNGPQGDPLAVHWVAREPTATNLELFNLQSALSVEDAIDIAARAGMPELNCTVADADGHIGWTIAGKIPQRVGNYNPMLPSSWANGDTGWRGWLAADEHPRIVNPDSGLIWTANNRIVGGKMAARMGHGGYALGARAGQIHADLKPLTQATPADMLAVQLDDRARFLARWRGVLLRLITPQAAAVDSRRADFRRRVATWDARAAIDAVGYRLVRLFHKRLRERVLTMLLAQVRAQYPAFQRPSLTQFEGPLWALMQHQPPNLLSADHASWNAMLLAVVDSIIADYYDPDSGFTHFTWGARNTVRVRHPLSRAIPLLSAWLDMPVLRLPGDSNMPRVQGVSFGASMRLVVAPGDEKNGIFELPGGQSGHPLSPYYGDQFMAWAAGKPTPFSPGQATHTLVLEPAQ